MVLFQFIQEFLPLATDLLSVMHHRSDVVDIDLHPVEFAARHMGLGALSGPSGQTKGIFLPHVMMASSLVDAADLIAHGGLEVASAAL